MPLCSCSTPSWADQVSPLRLTADRLKPDVYQARNVGLLVGDPAAFDDLVLYWNLRASGASVAFHSIAHFARLGLYLKARVARMREQITDREGGHTEFCSPRAARSPSQGIMPPLRPPRISCRWRPCDKASLISPEAMSALLPPSHLNTWALPTSALSIRSSYMME
jgi:hypothetical protein